MEKVRMGKDIIIQKINCKMEDINFISNWIKYKWIKLSNQKLEIGKGTKNCKIIEMYKDIQQKLLLWQ